MQSLKLTHPYIQGFATPPILSALYDIGTNGLPNAWSPLVRGAPMEFMVLCMETDGSVDIVVGQSAGEARVKFLAD